MASLPNDVLYDIFHRITVNAPSPSRIQRATIEPLFLSHVCRRWRQVALSNGTLWSYLCISGFGEPGTSQRERTFDIFHTWLKRSSKAPLSFKICCQERGEEVVEGRRQMELVVKSLIAEQQRWRDVEFRWQFTAYSSDFTSIGLTNMPILSSITLRADIKICDGTRIIPHINISRSPQLKVMNLSARHVFETGVNPIHSLRQAYFDIPDITCTEAASNCLALLMACPNLEDFDALHDGLDIDAIGHDTRHQKISESYARFVHNNIRRFGLWNPNSDVAALVIDRLTLPELHTLEFRTEMMPESHHILLEFIERSLPRLQKLEIWGCNAISEHLIPVLRMLPTLQGLVIGGCDDADELFEGLTWSGDGPITCPALRYIHLEEVESMYYEGLDALYSMAKSRGRDGTVPGIVTFNLTLKLPISRIRDEHGRISDAIPPESELLHVDIDLDKE